MQLIILGKSHHPLYGVSPKLNPTSTAPADTEQRRLRRSNVAKYATNDEKNWEHQENLGDYMETRLKRTLNCITSLPNGVRVKSKLITLVPADILISWALKSSRDWCVKKSELAAAQACMFCFTLIRTQEHFLSCTCICTHELSTLKLGIPLKPKMCLKNIRAQEVHWPLSSSVDPTGFLYLRQRTSFRYCCLTQQHTWQ